MYYGCGCLADPLSFSCLCTLFFADHPNKVQSIDFSFVCIVWTRYCDDADYLITIPFFILLENTMPLSLVTTHLYIASNNRDIIMELKPHTSKSQPSQSKSLLVGDISEIFEIIELRETFKSRDGSNHG